MKWLLTTLACVGIALSVFHARLAFPRFLAGPSPVLRDEAVGNAEKSLMLSTASGQGDVLVSAQDVHTVLSRLAEHRRREDFLERSMLISSGIVFGLSVGLLVLARRRL